MCIDRVHVGRFCWRATVRHFSEERDRSILPWRAWPRTKFLKNKGPLTQVGCEEAPYWILTNRQTFEETVATEIQILIWIRYETQKVLERSEYKKANFEDKARCDFTPISYIDAKFCPHSFLLHHPSSWLEEIQYCTAFLCRIQRVLIELASFSQLVRTWFEEK